jgi:hypothetical protein
MTSILITGAELLPLAELAEPFGQVTVPWLGLMRRPLLMPGGSTPLSPGMEADEAG